MHYKFIFSNIYPCPFWQRFQ